MLYQETHRDREVIHRKLCEFTLAGSCLKGTASLQYSFSSVDESSSRDSGVSSVSHSHNAGVNMVLGVSHHWSSLGVLDNGLSLDSHGDGDVVRGINMDGSGHRDDVLLVDGDVIGDINTTLNQDGVLHVVDLNLLLDD